ncbi:MAG: HAMP domain-containing protein [Nitrospirae bacterium]|nr:HAMP domain-containing protein [Nitrospirota bacterium]
MKNLKIVLGLLGMSILGIFITGIVLNYIGIEHGPLLIKIGLVFISVNIILFLFLLIFFVARNLQHLYSEKKQKTIGSKFRIKLVSAFMGLTLVPSILLFILSHELIKSSIDTWFSIEVQKPIYDTMDIAKTFYLEERQNAVIYAELIASGKGIIMTDGNVNYHTDKFITRLIKGTDNPDSDLVREAFTGKSDTEVISGENGDTIRAAAPVYENGKVTSVVIVETLISKDVVNKMESIKKAFNEYVQISAQQNPVRFIYFMMLTVATLLIIFLALWISLRIAKSITVPIRSLAEATSTVAHGDLDFRIGLKRDDEIGMLINSFNQMLDEIKNGKLSLETAYKDSDRRRLSMEAILETINTGVIVFNRPGRIITLNKAASLMLDIDKDKFTDKGYRELLDKLNSEEIDSMVKRLGERGFGSVEKEIHLYINGRPMDLRVYIAALKDSADNFLGTLVVFDNLTETILAQRALAWQEVAKRIAHEIKNPLTPIRLAAERLLKKWNSKSDDFDDVLRRSTNTIVKEVNSLRSLVDEFSRFGKMPKINLEFSNIKDILDEVVELYSNLRDTKIITSIKEMPEIEIDREQIKRALINLIDNAVQAQTTTIWLNAFHDQSLDLIRIEVIDDGTGIKEADKEKLFFPYFSTRKEGTGLGLAIVNSIISKHRGYIRVQDNAPKGTQFIIELPVG